MRNVFFIARLQRLACVAGLSLALSLVLLGCSSTPAGGTGTYTVKRGDTLYAIAYRHGLDYRDIARWNGIGRDYTIHPGQILRLSANNRAAVKSRPAGQPPPKPVVVAPTPAPIPWQWPVDGGTAKLTQILDRIDV